MTHYEKLATMIFRVMALLLFGLGIVITIIAIVSLAVVSNFAAVFTLIYYSLPFLLLGALFFFLSNKFAKLVCKGFDSNE